MIKALLLIFFPLHTWEGIVAAQRKWAVILLTYFLPLLLLVSLVEGYGLVRWGRYRGEFPRLTTFSVPQAVIYETARVLLTLGLVFVVAKLIKSLGETFHGRHTFAQAFTVAAYGFGPILVLRLLEVVPWLWAGIPWAVGVALAAGILYSGLPIVLRPDPPHALGLYLMSSLMVVLVTGLAQFVTVFYVQGKFTRLDEIVADLITRLHL